MNLVCTPHLRAMYECTYIYIQYASKRIQQMCHSGTRNHGGIRATFLPPKAPHFDGRAAVRRLVKHRNPKMRHVSLNCGMLAKIAARWQISRHVGKNRGTLANIAARWQKSRHVGKYRGALAKIAARWQISRCIWQKAPQYASRTSPEENQ